MKTALFLLGFISLYAFAGDLVVLDMKEYHNDMQRTHFIKELSRGFHDLGVVVVMNTGVNKELVTRAFRAMERFFALDEVLKKNYTGYIPFHAEKAEGATQGDYKEVLHFFRDHHQYPQEINIQDAIISYFRELEHYMQIFQEVIAVAMGMPKGFFLPITGEGASFLRAIHYPPHLGLWAEEHVDMDLFSIFPKATLDGLEIKTREGEWMKVDVPEGGMIITAGHFLESLSNGYFPAGRQRVVSYKKHLDRYALGFFVHPKDPSVLKPLSSMIEKTGGL